MSRRRGLGKGLEALIPVIEETADGLLQVPVSAISPNPMQPRTTMEPQALAELAASIKEHGLIQPLVVTQQGPEHYQLIAGERRWEAARLAGLATIPVVVKDATPQQVLELALVENIQRADLNPLEEATAFQQLVDEFGLTQEQVAERVGKSRVAVTNTLRLLRLPPEVKQALAKGAIREGPRPAGPADARGPGRCPEDGRQQGPQRAPDRRTGPPPDGRTPAPEAQTKAQPRDGGPGIRIPRHPGHQGQPLPQPQGPRPAGHPLLLGGGATDDL